MKNHELEIATRVTRFIIMAMVISAILLIVGVGVLVLIHIYILLREFRRRTDNVNMVERGNVGSNNMSQEDIEKLPCFDFKDKEKGINSPMDCAICLDNLKLGDKCRFLPQCDHKFHAECIDLWLLKSLHCPICRARIEFNGSVSVGQTSEDNTNMSETRIELREVQRS